MAASVGDSHDTALAESIVGLSETGAINVPGPWKSIGRIQWETLKWVARYNTERRHGAIGYVTPREKEDAFRESLGAAEKPA